MFLFCGDPHGSFDQILDAADAHPHAQIILLGDMEPDRPLSVVLASVWGRTWWIPGNHDADSIEHFHKVQGDTAAASRCVHGRVVTLPGGVRLAGLGGTFHSSVWHPGLDLDPIPPKIRSRGEHANLTPKEYRFMGGPPVQFQAAIYQNDYQKLSKMRADILVTHEAFGYHPNGFKVLDGLANQMGAGLCVHGHHHDRLDSSPAWEQQGFASFGIGLRGVSLIDLSGQETVIVEGERDGARANRPIHY